MGRVDLSATGRRVMNASTRRFVTRRLPHLRRILTLMLWFYERDTQSIELETSYDQATREYVVLVRHPGGREEAERFSDPESCRLWLVAFESRLENEQFVRRGPPVFLPYGWPRGRTH